MAAMVARSAFADNDIFRWTEHQIARVPDDARVRGLMKLRKLKREVFEKIQPSRLQRTANFTRPNSQTTIQTTPKSIAFMRLVSCFSACFSCGHRQPIRALASAASSAAAAPLDLERVASIIASDECRNVVVMVGAGCSTSAGIPDFRTPGTGLYDNLASYGLPHPEAIFDIDVRTAKNPPTHSC